MTTRIGYTGSSFKLFNCQARILSSKADITVATTGRGVGKTVSAGHWVSRRLFETEAKGLLGSPSYAQTNEILNYLIELLSVLRCETLLNKMAPTEWHPSIVDYRNILTVMHHSFNRCRHIHISSTDNFEALRGKSVGWMLLDEAALINEDAYYSVLLPTLRGYGTSHIYRQLLLTSPRGSVNWVSKLARQPEVLHIKAPSWENILEWPPSKVEKYRNLLSDLAFRQEIAGEIIDCGSSAMFYMFNTSRIKHPPNKEPDEIWISSDQNVSPMCSIIMHRYGDVWYAYREAVVPDSANVDDMVSLLKREDMQLVNRSVYLTGDSSGNNRSVVSRKSFYESLIDGLESKRVRIKNKTLKSNPSVFKTAEEVNAMFQNSKLLISPLCKSLINDLEMTRYTSDMSTDKKYHDPHLCFTAETRIMMADGSSKAIADVVPGDLIVTPAGPEAVIVTALIYNDADIIRLNHKGTHIGVTPDHELAVFNSTVDLNKISRIPFGKSEGTQVLSVEFQDKDTPLIISGVSLSLSEAEEGKADVYCLAVPCGWFVLESGLVVKNCDALRYWCHRINHSNQASIDMKFAK